MHAHETGREREAGVLLAGLPAELGEALPGRLPGARIRAVGDLATALAELARRWDLVVVDHDLPGGGGVELVRELRVYSWGRTVPILYCIRSTLPVETAHFLVDSLRVSRLLFHPLEAGALQERITAFLLPRPVAGEDARPAAELASALAGIWERFRGVTLERVSTLEEAAVALLSGSLDAGLRRRAERDAHKLAGSVGTFGFAEGSRLARAVELQLEGERPLRPADALALSERVNELRAILERPPAPTRPPAPASALASREASALEGERPGLLVVTPDGEFAQRVVMEAEGRGFSARWTPAAEADAASATARAVVVDCSAGVAPEAGVELISSLARRSPPPVVVAVSDRDTLAERVEVARRGARSFLRRPLSPGAVVECVEQHLARAEVAGSRVLVVDDDAGLLVTLEMLLEVRGIEMVAVSDPADFWRALGSARPDLVVLDQDMPGLQGEDLLRVLRAEPRWRDLPVLFLTAAGDPGTVQRIFAAGASDFVRKPFAGPELLTRITSRLEQTRLRSALQEGSGTAGLPSRARVSGEISRLLQIAGRQGESLALARIDLDRFSRLNQRLGEPAADEVLRRVGVLLQTLLRAGDVVGWWGGDEFVAALYGAGRDLAAERLAQVREAARAEPVAAGDERLEITFSAGIAEFPMDGQDLAQLCGAAEGALLRAKEAGGDRSVVVGREADAPRTELVDVVLVEDDDVLAELLLHAFATQGLHARHIRDGERALDLLSGPQPAVRPRVLLLDVDLPVLDGLSVLRELSREGIQRRTHVIMLTVRATEREVLESLELGAADHVAKPFGVPILLQRIRSVLLRG